MRLRIGVRIRKNLLFKIRVSNCNGTNSKRGDLAQFHLVMAMHSSRNSFLSLRVTKIGRKGEYKERAKS